MSLAVEILIQGKKGKIQTHGQHCNTQRPILHKFNNIRMVNDLLKAQRAFGRGKTALTGAICAKFLTISRGIFGINGNDVEVLLPSKALR